MRPSLLSASIAVILVTAPCHAEWKQVPVPTQERITAQGDVWLRCFIRVPANMTTPAEKDLWRDSITLSVAGISGPFKISLNGQMIAEGTALPPDKRRRFKVPKGIFEPKAFNVLAIQLTGDATRSGLAAPPILAGYFDELELVGAWEMHTGEPAPQDLVAHKEQPQVAAYTEAGFRQSFTPLSANAQLMPGVKLPAKESHAQMKPADDLMVELMLSEPQLAQPTHISFDERGRMWVSQYRQYPFPAGLKMISRDKYYRSQFDKVPPAPPKHDRGADIISVHEDTDGDGIFDLHRNVLEGLNMANAAVRGHGGIWVMHSPYLVFYPDANGDDIPDRDPEVRLAGFGLEDTHSAANGLMWGPDGWLYGAQGSTITSRVVRPGVDPEGFEGIYHEGCMVWRYHPRTKEYEIFAEGGGNVFGLDFDAQGRLYSGHNGGSTRGWHYVQSGLFLKQGLDPGKFGPQGRAFDFGFLDQIKSRHPIPRFTHAIIIAEGTALPERYSGRLFGADPLARNVVVAERYSRGSTFETSDSGKAVTNADPAFRPVFLTNAPDGSVYMGDFYEEFIAHGQNYQGQIDPTTGRIYRIRGKQEKLNKDVDLSRKTTAELISTLSHPNRWQRHTAVRLLGERRDPSAVPLLKEALNAKTEQPSLEALWALHQMEALDEKTALVALRHPDPAVRAWSVRLMGDKKTLPPAFAKAVVDLIATEPNAEVRSQIASTSRRLGVEQGISLASALVRRDVDSADPYIPMLCWWTLEAHCASDRERVIAAVPWQSNFAKEWILPRLMRRFAAAGSRGDLLTCAELMKAAPAAEHRKFLMNGFEEAFKGRTPPPLPEPLIRALAESGMASRYMRVRLGDAEATKEALQVIADPKAKLEDRLLCVRLFGEVKLPESIPALLNVARGETNSELRKAALTSLLKYEENSIGEEIARAYSTLPSDVRPAAQTLLTSRPGWIIPFLKLIESGAADKATVPPAISAVLREHENPEVAALARRVFEQAMPVQVAASQAEHDRIRKLLAAAPGDPYKGEPLYMQRCSACHALFHKGGKIGPDLTAYQRNDLGTMLTSIVTPNAEIREGFINRLITTIDGRTLSGFVSDQDGSVVVLRGLDGQDVSIPRSEIREIRASAASLMPEGLLNGLSDQELRDFFAYLRIPQPITR